MRKLVELLTERVTSVAKGHGADEQAIRDSVRSAVAAAYVEGFTDAVGVACGELAVPGDAPAAVRESAARLAVACEVAPCEEAEAETTCTRARRVA